MSSIYGTSGRPMGSSYSPTITMSMPDFDFLSLQYGKIGHIICPDFNAPALSGEFPKYRKEDYFDDADAVAYTLNSTAPISTMEYSDDTFLCRRWQQATAWSMEVAQQYKDWFDVPKTHEDRIKFKIISSIEKRRIAAAFSTDVSNVTSTQSAATAWTTTASAHPVADVDALQKKIYEACGAFADTMVISQSTYLNLVSNDDLKTLTVASGAGNPAVAKNMQAPWLADMFNLKTVLIANEPYWDNSASKWKNRYPDDKALLFCSYSGNDITNPAQWMRRLWYNMYPDVQTKIQGTDSKSRARFDLYEDVEKNFKVLRGVWWDCIKVVNPNAAGIITGIAS